MTVQAKTWSFTDAAIKRSDNAYNNPCGSVYLLKLGRAECVAELLAALGQRLSGGQVGHQPLLHLRVGQDGSHDVRCQDTGQVHYR